MIEFNKRPHIKRTDLGRFRSWKSLDGRYRIVEIFGASWPMGHSPRRYTRAEAAAAFRAFAFVPLETATQKPH